MKASERSVLVDQVQNDVNTMMSRAGDILMEYVNGLDDEKLSAFVNQFNETCRTSLLSELVKTIQRKETLDNANKK